MEYETVDFVRLTDEVCSFLSVKSNRDGFNRIEAYCEESDYDLVLRLEYIYDRYTSRKKSQTARAAYLDTMANIIGFTSFAHYLQGENTYTKEQADLFDKIDGDWESIVRCNSGAEQLLISRVKFLKEKGRLLMRLLGGENMFEGEVSIKGYCLVAKLKSSGVKELHLIFKLGNLKNIQILQGTYSAISSGNDPICGVELLIRIPEDKEGNKLKKHKRVNFENYRREDGKQELVLNYFKDKIPYKINNVSTFDWYDLA